jgi:hypothetical protein
MTVDNRGIILEFAFGTQQNHEKVLYVSRCPGQDSNRKPAEFKSRIFMLD